MSTTFELGRIVSGRNARTIVLRVESICDKLLIKIVEVLLTGLYSR